MNYSHCICDENPSIKYVLCVKSIIIIKFSAVSLLVVVVVALNLLAILNLTAKKRIMLTIVRQSAEIVIRN